MQDNNWILKDMSIRQDWNKKGLYVGNVSFTNGVEMQMSLALDNLKCGKMIAILQSEIVESATNLGQMLVKSMPLAIEQTAPEKPEIP